MYSRYSEHQPFIPMNNRLRREGPEPPRHEPRRGAPESILPVPREAGGLAGREDGKKKPGFLSGLLKNLDFDSDDILLILIILFLSKESDDEELLIMLGLMLFMGL